MAISRSREQKLGGYAVDERMDCGHVAYATLGGVSIGRNTAWLEPKWLRIIISIHINTNINYINININN